MTDSLIHEHVQNQKKLLDLELRSEQEEQKESFSTSSSSSSSSCAKHKTAGEEREEGLTLSSRILNNLELEDWSIGLMGRTIVTFSTIVSTDNQHDSAKKSLLSAHRLSVGDQVEILHKSDSIHNNSSNILSTKNNRRHRPNGVISALTDKTISIALSTGGNHHQQHSNSSNNDEENGVLGSLSPPYTILPQSSVDVHRKLLKSLDMLAKHGDGHRFAGSVIRTIFDTTSSSPSSAPLSKITPFNKNLDSSQLEAIEFALYDGPPGTGKTTTVAELIHQAVHIHKWKVLVTAPSNVAVDNILQRLVAPSSRNKAQPRTTTTTTTTKKKHTTSRCSKDTTTNALASPPVCAVRLGHPARIQPSILPFSLDALVTNSDGTEIVMDIRAELKEHLEILSNPKRGGVEKRAAYREMKLLRKEIRQREEKVVDGLLLGAQVVLCTNVGAASTVLDKFEKSPLFKPFDLVVIDEAAQALEASCWIPILRGKRLVLAGDHRQLPPTIKSRNSEVTRELGKTLFHKIMKRDDNGKSRNAGMINNETERNHGLSRMLKLQYRMHEDIANWASNAIYGGQLQSHDSVKARKLYHLPHVSAGSEITNLSSVETTIKDATLLLIDTAGCDMFESTNAVGSRYNEGEADLVGLHVRNLLKIGLKAEEIAVITPYNGQVELLRTMLLEDIPKLEIRSVDGFQGSEREAVVLSLVRSSERGGIDGIGFLKDERRLNVAVTRAKRHCCIICDSETVHQNSFLKNLVNWFEEKGVYMSAIEFNHDLGNQTVSANDEIVQLSAMLENESTVSHGSRQKRTKEITKTSEDDIPGQPKVDNIIVKKGNTKTVPLESGQTESGRQQCRDKMYETLSFFAEIAENGEEMEVIISPTISLGHVHDVCDSLSLLYLIEITTGSEKKITVCAMDAVQQHEEKQQRRSELMDRLALFADMAENGEEMELDDYAPTFDYNLVPEICDKLNLVHQIDTLDGTDKCIIHAKKAGNAATISDENNLATLSYTHELTPITRLKNTGALSVEDFQIDDTCLFKKVDSNFEQRQEHNPSEKMTSHGKDAVCLSKTDDSIIERKRENNRKEKKVLHGKEASDSVGSINSILGSLARERLARASSKVGDFNLQKKKNSSKEIKVVKTSKVKKKKISGKDANLDSLDDMAFLDTQIQKVQTSHGRKIEARGSNYNTIINGILIAKPKGVEKKRDDRTSTVLKEKLKKSQHSRRAKKKKK